MNIRECYGILRVGQEAGLDEVKSAFRKLAFELHPDLNPDNPHASSMFQRVNEAYVILKTHLEAEGDLGRVRREARQQAKEKREQTRAEQKSRAEQKAREKARAKQQRQATGPGRAESRQTPPSQDQVLRDILRDPFARQVFEDIYSRIRQGKNPSVPAKPPKKRKLRLEWGDKTYDLDLSKGIVRGTRSWVKGWMDEEQTMHLPLKALRPGSKVRLNIRRGWRGKQSSVTITLPQDFVIGRPVRLKGLGRKLGPWQGDLYLRLLAKP